VTGPVPHWPGQMVPLAAGERVYVAETPRSVPDAGQASVPDERQARELVLCVHGMSGSATNWTDFMAELAPDFDCAAVDLPGSGFSPPPAAKSGYSITALARTVVRLIEALDRGPVHLVGNSMGGAVSIRVAATRPDLLRTLTLVSPVLPDLRVRRELLQFPVAGLPFIGEWVLRRTQLMPAENRVAGVLATCYYDPGAMHPERFMLDVAELKRRDELGYNATTLSRAARTIVAESLRPRRYSLWRAAERITVPTLVTFGSHDRLVNPRLAAPARRVFRHGTVTVLPQTGHVAQMERPGLVAELFREMVDRTRARGGGVGNSGRPDPVDA
jgi:pimeloyl-ACP methyl ester carboxylesterase